MKSYKGNYYIILRDKPTKEGEFVSHTKDDYYESPEGEIFKIHHYYGGSTITRVNKIPKNYSKVNQSKKFHMVTSNEPIRLAHMQWYIKSIAKHILQSAKKHKTEKSFEL